MSEVVIDCTTSRSSKVAPRTRSQSTVALRQSGTLESLSSRRPAGGAPGRPGHPPLSTSSATHLCTGSVTIHCEPSLCSPRPLRRSVLRRRERAGAGRRGRPHLSVRPVVSSDMNREALLKQQDRTRAIVEGALLGDIGIVFLLMRAFLPLPGVRQILRAVATVPFVMLVQRRGLRLTILAAIASYILFSALVGPILALAAVDIG